MANQNKVTSFDTLGKITIDFGDICRFCLTEIKDSISVKEECLYEESKNVKPESVLSFITKLRIIKMNNLENFPSKICKNCYELVELFHNFSQLVQKSDSLLKQYYENTSKETNEELISKDNIRSQIEKTDIPIHALTQAQDSRLELSKLPGTIKEDQLEVTKDISSGCQSGNLTLGKESPHSCSECSLNFSSIRALNVHHAAKHTNRRFTITLRFKCEKCIMSFGDLKTLRSHYKLTHNVSHSKLNDIHFNSKVMQSHIEHIKFFCFQCSPCAEFKTQNLLIKHLEDCHEIKELKGSPVVYSCAHCPSPTFATRLALDQHMLCLHKVKHSEITWADVKYLLVAQKGLPSALGGQGRSEEWCCPSCPASCTRKPALKLHLRAKHNQVCLEGMKCPECPETFLTNRRLSEHGISVHGKYLAWWHDMVKEDCREKRFECDVCEKRYVKKCSLKRHIMKAHLGTGLNGAVKCPYCKKEVSNKFNLKSHIEFIHEALFVCCPICKKKINLRTIGRHYKVHKAKVEGDFSGNVYRCKLCGKILKSKKSFENHEKIHENIRDEVCDVCGKEFTCKKVMRVHRKSHEGVARKTYTCSECEKVFSGRHSLKRHLLLHSGQKNFICEMCSKGFYTIEELNRHVRCHKRDYRFTCPLCAMKFLYKSSLRHHLMRHRNIRPYKCEFCEKMFIERAKLNMHVSTKHNVEVEKKKSVWKDPKTYVPLDDLL